MDQKIEEKNMEVKQREPAVTLTNFFGGNTIASSIITAGFLIVIGILAGAFIIKGSVNTGSDIGSNTAKVKITDRADQPVIGNPKAKVTMYEFGDFQCPYCKSFFQGAYAELKSKYVDTGKVKIVFRHLPIQQHVNAQVSAEAAECANRQGQFEAYYSILYTLGQADGAGLDVTSLKKYAGQVGLDMTAFNTCLDTHETRGAIAVDSTLASSIGVNATPTFYINGVQVLGAQPAGAFEQVIDQALAK